jgi:hypothetical protein
LLDYIQSRIRFSNCWFFSSKLPTDQDWCTSKVKDSDSFENKDGDYHRKHSRVKITYKSLINFILSVICPIILGDLVNVLDVPDAHVDKHAQVHKSNNYSHEFVSILAVCLSHNKAWKYEKYQKLRGQLVELQFVKIAYLITLRLCHAFI